MSRSVSYANNSAWKFYLRPERFGETSIDWGEMQDDWNDWVEDLTGNLEERFGSLVRCDRWLGEEDHAILENGMAYIGISEYCGLVCLWGVPKGGWGDANWCEQIIPSIEKMLRKCYPSELLVPMGTFSNGEQCFSMAEEPEALVTSKEGRLW